MNVQKTRKVSFVVRKILILKFNFNLLYLDNVTRWERTVHDDEEELERAKQAEQKQMSEIELDMKEVDRLKAQRQTKKQEVDQMDEVISKVQIF